MQPHDEDESLALPKDVRLIKFMMDPQSRRALDQDLKELDGNVKLKDNGLLSFNLFMHLFIIITRHSKEQFIKEQRKVAHRRLRAFRVKEWKVYYEIVQHELDMERCKYQDIVNYVLNSLEIVDGCYKSSFVKSSMKRAKDG